ncbi:MAG: aromatic-ring-hydroxylating dioxygenase subunit beta [Candidatus Rokuibacteriota bacterium]
MAVTRPRPAPPASRLTPDEAAAFLFHEASLLDQGRLDAWLALFTDDATYWVPLEANQTDPLETSSIVYDDRRLLEVRVRQTKHPRAHARVPAARTVHQVANVRVTADDGRDATVASSLVMVEYRQERQRVWGALVEHRLRRTADGLRIAAKRVDLVNSESELEGIACLF